MKEAKVNPSKKGENVRKDIDDFLQESKEVNTPFDPALEVAMKAYLLQVAHFIDKNELPVELITSPIIYGESPTPLALYKMAEQVELLREYVATQPDKNSFNQQGLEGSHLKQIEHSADWKGTRIKVETCVITAGLEMAHAKGILVPWLEKNLPDIIEIDIQFEKMPKQEFSKEEILADITKHGEVITYFAIETLLGGIKSMVPENAPKGYTVNWNPLHVQTMLLKMSEGEPTQQPVMYKKPPFAGGENLVNGFSSPQCAAERQHHLYR